MLQHGTFLFACNCWMLTPNVPTNVSSGGREGKTAEGIDVLMKLPEIEAGRLVAVTLDNLHALNT